MTQKYAFKLSEITAMQLACIKQLNDLKDEILENRRTRGVNRRAAKGLPHTGDVVHDIDKEISERKYLVIHPSEVQI